MSDERRWPVVTLVLTAIAVVVHVLPDSASALEWYRDSAEVWRWVTGHFAHFGGEHLLWNAGTFAALALLVESRSRVALLGCVVLSALAIPAGLSLLAPEVGSYRGLSGVDSALFAWLAIRLLRDEGLRGRGLVALGALVLLGAKLTFESVSGATLFVDSTRHAWVPVPLAHVLGGLCGAAIEASFRTGRRS